MGWKNRRSPSVDPVLARGELEASLSGRNVASATTFNIKKKVKMTIMLKKTNHATTMCLSMSSTSSVEVLACS